MPPQNHLKSLPFALPFRGGSSDERTSDEEKAPSPSVESVSNVGAWLSSLGYTQYVDFFAENEVDGSILKTLTSEELRDDLSVTNLKHRRDILYAIANLIQAEAQLRRQPLPEHGRILDHLSNVRTYHSWIRVGIQFLGFAIVTLRLAPNFRSTGLVSGAAVYCAIVGILALTYGIYRYKKVIDMIEASGPANQSYTPDRAGVISILILVLIAAIMALSIIAVKAS